MKTVNAKKKYGQNFLKDKLYVEKIVEAMPKDKHIVEIGPGLGDLTCELVKYGGVTAYEIDIDMLKSLSVRFSKEIESGVLELKLGDVLGVYKAQGVLYNCEYNLVANLPYNVATRIILEALEDEDCKNILVMVQKEVARKFTAQVKQREFSSLGVISASYCKARTMLFDVPASAFEPSPKVESCVIFLEKNIFKKVDEGFKKFLKVCFSQTRKKLIKNLKQIADKDSLENFFLENNLNENLRPHELDKPLYHQLYKKVIKNGRFNESGRK